MQNSAMMALRALILLVCLVAVPLFAIFGKNAPDVIKSLIQKYTGNASNSLSTAAVNDAPVFRPGILAANVAQPNAGMKAESTSQVGVQPATARGMNGADRSPNSPPGGELANSPEQRLQTTGSSDGHVQTMPPAVSPGVGQSAANTAIGAASRTAGAMRGQPDRIPGTTTALDSTTPAGSAGLPPALSGPGSQIATSGAATNGFPPDYFHSSEQRLRQLGATYYLLETLGPEINQYRFFCKIAAGANGEEVGFYAIERDPLSAMKGVIRQIETWRNRLNPSP